VSQLVTPVDSSSSGASPAAAHASCTLAASWLRKSSWTTTGRPQKSAPYARELDLLSACTLGSGITAANLHTCAAGCHCSTPARHIDSKTLELHRACHRQSLEERVHGADGSLGWHKPAITYTGVTPSMTIFGCRDGGWVEGTLQAHEAQ